MKEGWERRNTIIQLTVEDLIEIIKLFDSSFCVMKFELLSDGFSHTNYKVTTNYRITMEYFLYESKMPKWLNKGRSTELMDFCIQHAKLFELDTSTPRLVHGDFNGLNILMDETKVNAILDWEYVIAGSMYLDIGNLIRYEEYPHFQQFKTGLAAGLSERGERLPEEWEQIAKLADLIALSSMLDNDFGGTNRVSDINRLIESTLKNPLFNTI